MAGDALRSRQLDDTAVAAKLSCGPADRTRLGNLQLLTVGEHRVIDIVAVVEGRRDSISGRPPCLKDCGLVIDRPASREVHYRFVHPDLVALLDAGETVTTIRESHTL